MLALFHFPLLQEAKRFQNIDKNFMKVGGQGGSHRGEGHAGTQVPQACRAHETPGSSPLF